MITDKVESSSVKPEGSKQTSYGKFFLHRMAAILEHGLVTMFHREGLDLNKMAFIDRARTVSKFSVFDCITVVQETKE